MYDISEMVEITLKESDDFLKVKETQSGGCPTIHNEPVLFKLERGLTFTCVGVNSLQ